MPDLVSIAGVFSALKAASDISQGILSMRDTAKIQGKVIELNGQIIAAQTSAMAAQTDQMALSDRVRELEEIIAQMETWDAEKEKYELSNLATGAFAYTMKPEAQGTRPDH